MALDFGRHEDVVFTRAPLLAVLCQVKFQPIFSLMSEAGVVGFQEAIRNDYPKATKAIGTQLSMSSQDLQVAQSAPTFQFRTEDDAWTVGLATDFVALETSAYSDFGEFEQRLDRIIQTLARTVHPANSRRIGLRKVNRLKHPRVKDVSGWAGLLKPGLLGLPVTLHESSTAAASFAWSEVRFQDDDNLMVVRHGIDPEDGSAYLIDVDYFTERPYSLESTRATRELIRYYSDGITSFFHWCLEPELVAYLGPRPRKREE